MAHASQTIDYNDSKNNSALKTRYSIGKKIGVGSTGTVYRAHDRKTGEKCAMKIIDKKYIEKTCGKSDLLRIYREIEIMSVICHENVLQVIEVFESSQHIVIILELADNGEIYELIEKKGRLSENEARCFFKQLLSAIGYLHSEGIVHRDLKLENILLDSHHRLKICDFGLANSYGENKLTTYCGSALYSSPEIVNGIPYEGPEVDMWSLGVILYTFVYGNMPFSGEKFDVIKKNITLGQFTEPDFFSGAHNLIVKLLNPKSSRRATLLQASMHDWIGDKAFVEKIASLHKHKNIKNYESVNDSKISIQKMRDAKFKLRSKSLDNSENAVFNDFQDVEEKLEKTSLKEIIPERDNNTIDILSKLNNTEPFEINSSKMDKSNGITTAVNSSLNEEENSNEYSQYTLEDMMSELLTIDKSKVEIDEKEYVNIVEPECEFELRNLLTIFKNSIDEENGYDGKFNNVCENETDFILNLCDSSLTHNE